MITSEYEINRLLKKRRELKWELSGIDERLFGLGVNPEVQENHSRKSGFPVLGDLISLMLDILERVVRWIVKQIFR